MLRKRFLFAFVLVLSTHLVFAVAPKKSASIKDCPQTIQTIPDPGYYEILPDGLGPGSYPPLNTDEPVGEVFLFGTSWYDIQHNGTCGRQLQVDSDGYVHLVWMNGLNTGASLRHIYYQLMDPMDQLVFTVPVLGIQIDQSPRAGYTVMELHSDNRAMPLFHQTSSTSANAHSALAFDYFPRVGAFQAVELPWVYEGHNDLEVIWPRMDKDIDDRYHIVSTENPLSGIAGDPQRIYYCRAAFDPTTYSLEFETPEQIEIVYTMTISADVAASPVSNRVAVGWMHPCATEPDTTQYDNDVIVCISNDGETWDWTDTINVTQWIPPDYNLLPDTLLANKDTLRAYTDMCLYFDYNDILHVFFSTQGYYPIDGTLAWGNGYIWHWDEINQVYSMVANGWFDNGFYDPGAWNSYVQRPSAAADEETGDLYCMYQRYLQPLWPSTTNPFPYQVGDTTDFSAAGYPNGEIWMTKSNDGGYSWAEGINVTNTHSPDAPAGLCMSELTPSMAPQIYNDQCHIFYVFDKDAGAVVQMEGTWTLNDIVYQRTLTSDIPDTPLLPPYPMHCDSTGMPELVSPYLQIGLSTELLNFNEVPLGEEAELPFTVTNISDSTLNLNTVTISDPVFTSDFNPAAINPGGNMTINVTFTPLEPVTYQAVLTLNTPYESVEIDLAGEGVGDFQLTLTPENPPIIIPENGGSFDFNLAAVNTSSSTITTDIWTEIILPGAGSVGPLILAEDIFFDAGYGTNRDRTQEVPSFAPPGTFTYYAYSGSHPWVVEYNDTFTFTKTGSDNGGNLGNLADWICSGEYFCGESPALVTPDSYLLHQPRPNPFNNETLLTIELPASSDISLKIFDIQGREILVLTSGWHPAGIHEIKFNSQGLSSGCYFANLQAGNHHQTRKILLLK